MTLVVFLCQSLSTTIMNTKNMTSSNTLSFPDCQKLVLEECRLDITNTEELGQITRCVAEGWMAVMMEETNPIIMMLETMSRKRMETMKLIPPHHHQERPRLSPSANFNNLAMQERGRMGAHPASNSIFHEESVRSYKPAPGISRMPPIPMKLNMKMNAGGPATPVSQPKLGGTLSLITPVYAVGIIVFFVFTLWKIFFKDKEIEEDLEEEEDAKTYAADIKWDDVKSRISKISDIVEKVVDKQADNNPEKGMEDGPSDDEEDFSKQFENKQSDEMKYMDKERNIETFTPSGRISPGKLEKAKDAFDPRDLEISLLKARLEETEKAMERIVAHMGIVTSRLAPHVIAQALEGVNFDQDTASEKLKQGVNLEESESGNCIYEQIDCIPGSSENI